MSGGYTYKPGTKLLLEPVYGGKYAGNVHHCEDDKITLIKVYNWEAQTEGQSNFSIDFYQREIRKITVLEEVYEPPSDDTYLSFYQKHDENLDVIQNFKYISKEDISFNKAIECLKTYDVISIAGLVSQLDRKLLLLGVGTGDQVFIFNLLSMGETAFENGLKEIFESNEILKVVHVHNLLSDSLFHNHNVSFRYFFDTEVADLTVSFKENSAVRPKRRSLEECLRFYFDIPEEVISVFSTSLIPVYNPPMPENFKILMAIQVVYLLDLKKHLEEKLSIGQGVARDFCLNFRRQSTLADSWNMNTRKIPKKLQDLKTKAVPSELNAENSEIALEISISHLFMPVILSDDE